MKVLTPTQLALNYPPFSLNQKNCFLNKAASLTWSVIIGTVLSVSTPTWADDDEKSVPHRNGNTLEIMSSVLGIERFKEYSANPNALGYDLTQFLGIEASYYDLGDSKFIKQRNEDAPIIVNIGGRMDVKLAIDISTRIGQHLRMFSRVGLYLWDIDMNYNRMTHEFDSSHDGNSRMLGFGAAVAKDDARLSVEYELLNPELLADHRDRQRVLLNLVSKF